MVPKGECGTRTDEREHKVKSRKQLAIQYTQLKILSVILLREATLLTCVSLIYQKLLIKLMTTLYSLN